MGRFPRRTERALRKAGWRPGRRVDPRQWCSEIKGIALHPAAEAFLTEFGGLDMRIGGLGRTSAREPFTLDPSLCTGEEGRFLDWSGWIGRSLYPLGELDHGRFFLGIDEEAEIYLVIDWLARFGRGDDGLTALCEGVKPVEIPDA
jgi:hypothetical protein